MESKSNKILILCIIIFILTIIIGYFLWTILIPIQDFSLMDKQELLRTQKELALNYDLGKNLLYIGFLGFISSTLILISNNIKLIKRQK